MSDFRMKLISNFSFSFFQLAHRTSLQWQRLLSSLTLVIILWPTLMVSSQKTVHCYFNQVSGLSFKTCNNFILTMEHSA